MDKTFLCLDVWVGGEHVSRREAPYPVGGSQPGGVQLPAAPPPGCSHSPPALPRIQYTARPHAGSLPLPPQLYLYRPQGPCQTVSRNINQVSFSLL